ncbi:hypothetical protein KCP77_16275 [Salmonella enterica subsp. enterica]|nr:hypothetical protein KCP77_16275 [Salmonella enterica subsp. enterica]
MPGVDFVAGARRTDRRAQMPTQRLIQGCCLMNCRNGRGQICNYQYQGRSRRG